MAIGIYAGLYVLSKFKDRSPFAPRVDFVGLEDGLLVIRCARKLTSKDTLVKVKASFGTVLAQIKVESYDKNQNVYRLSVEDHEVLAAQLPDERREAVRLSRMLPVHCDLSGPCSLMTEDISETGARILTPEPLPSGARLSLALELGTLRLQLEAEVAWSAEKLDGSAHCGTRFLNLTPAQSYNIRCYVQDQLEREQQLKILTDQKA